MAASDQSKLETLNEVMAAFNAHDADRVVSFFAEDSAFLAARGAETRGRRVEGREAIAAAFTARFAEVPDLRYEDGAHFVSGDRGLSEWTATGTTVDGVPVEVRGCDVWTFDADGRIVLKDCFWKIVDA